MRASSFLSVFQKVWVDGSQYASVEHSAEGATDLRHRRLPTTLQHRDGRQQTDHGVQLGHGTDYDFVRRRRCFSASSTPTCLCTTLCGPVWMEASTSTRRQQCQQRGVNIPDRQRRSDEPLVQSRRHQQCGRGISLDGVHHYSCWQWGTRPSTRRSWYLVDTSRRLRQLRRLRRRHDASNDVPAVYVVCADFGDVELSSNLSGSATCYVVCELRSSCV